MARSAAALMRARAASRSTLTDCANALLEDMRRESFQHEEIDAYHAPSECHELVTAHDPERILRRLGRTMKWWRRQCERRGISNRWLHMHGFPTYTPRATRQLFREVAR